MNAPDSHPIPHDVARLICGAVDDLKCSLNHCTDTALLERTLVEARQLREGKTKVLMIERALRKLKRAAAAPAAVVHEGYFGPCQGTPLDKAAIAKLADGTKVEVVWKSGNGPHVHVVRNDLTDAQLAQTEDGVRTNWLLTDARFVAVVPNRAR